MIHLFSDFWSLFQFKIYVNEKKKINQSNKYQ